MNPGGVHPDDDGVEFPPWAELLRFAQREVAQVQRALPAEVREAAGRLPVTYFPAPEEAMIAEGLDPDLLGLFVGDPLSAAGSSPQPLPAQVLLFLDNLWDFAAGDWEVFREEIRTTYLHELGHYLGLGEEDLDERGLA